MEANETNPQGIVKILYLEVLRKDEYTKWLQDPSYVGEALAKQRKPSDFPQEFQQRFDISHLNNNLAAWQDQITKLKAPFYSYDDVISMVDPSPSRVFEYFLDDLKWECEFSVKIRESVNGNICKTLVIHLPNDGYFYIDGIQMEEYLGKVKRSSIPNNRHRNTCHEGWSSLDKNVWEKLHPFETFMTSWFGENYTITRMQKTIMYHANANRIDLCIRHMDHFVGIEFSFERSYPLALDDDWWDQF